ncbi:hypothetical protein MPSEU_000806300 [Mayamaea pseudoterrestris]|nr:hypothetical protein MPSEU_000806300 [Mayamaea pseudoterrestris]
MMRQTRYLSLLFWLVLALSLRRAHCKNRFGMLFQMNTHGQGQSRNEIKSDDTDDIKIQPVHVNQTLLREQLELAKNRIQEQVKINHQLQQLQQNLGAENSKLPTQDAQEGQSRPDPTTDSITLDEVESRLAAQRQELEKDWAAEVGALKTRLAEAQNELQELKLTGYKKHDIETPPNSQSVTLEQLEARLLAQSHVEQELKSENEELENRLAEAQKEIERLRKLNDNKDQEIDADVTAIEELESRLIEQREELVRNLTLDFEASIAETHSELEEYQAMAEDLKIRLDNYEEELNDARTRSEELRKESELTKQKLSEVMKQLEQTVQAARVDKALFEHMMRDLSVSATYWESSFQNRAYLNVTHLGEFAEIIYIAVTAPVVETTHALYRDHVKDSVHTILESAHSVYAKHVAPHFTKHAAPLYEKHVAPTVKSISNIARSFKSKVVDTMSLVRQDGMNYLVEAAESSCRRLLGHVEDEQKRAKVEAVCNDAEPFVTTILALPLVLLFGRLFIWLLLLPLRFLLHLSPLRFNELQSVSSDDKEAS